MLIFWGGRKTGEPGEKPLELGENQQQTQPTYDAGSGNRTRDTLALTTAPAQLALCFVVFVL